jgi:MGT family glycosyltransferase
MTMARILAYTSYAVGHLYPVVPILDELRRRGHEIAVRTLASQMGMLRARGLDARPVDPRAEAVRFDDGVGGSRTAGLQKLAQAFLDKSTVDLSDVRQAIVDERPDALLLDVASYGGIAAAEAWGGPWASFSSFLVPLSSVDAPPYGPGFKPARHALQRLRDRVFGPTVRRVFENAMLPAINGPRREVGLPEVHGIDEFYLRQPLVLYMTAEPFEYPRRSWPESIVMVGPCDWNPDGDHPQWMDSIEHPVVLVTTSSEFQNDGRLVRVALEALAGEPFTVVATQPVGELESFETPANARLARFLPHAQLLDRAVCAVTHAGMGVTQKALARGVPVCAVPFSRDQFEVARRVEVAQAGSRLVGSQLSRARLRRHVHEAIGRRDGAQRLKAAFEATGGVRTAADAFEQRVLMIGADA